MYPPRALPRLCISRDEYMQVPAEGLGAGADEKPRTRDGVLEHIVTLSTNVSLPAVLTSSRLQFREIDV